VNQTGGLFVSEGGDMDAFSVTLKSRPASDVTLRVSTDATEASLSMSTLVFPPKGWDQPMVVTVTGVDDREVDGDIFFEVLVATATTLDTNYKGLDATVGVLNMDGE
jgi:hypothetical protein